MPSSCEGSAYVFIHVFIHSRCLVDGGFVSTVSAGCPVQEAPTQAPSGALSPAVAEQACALLGAALMVAAAEAAAVGQRRASRLAPRALNQVCLCACSAFPMSSRLTMEPVNLKVLGQQETGKLQQQITDQHLSQPSALGMQAKVCRSSCNLSV